MKRGAAEIIRADKLNLLHGVVQAIFGLDEPLRQLCLALLALHERQSGETPRDVLVRPVSLHAEHFEGLLPHSVSITRLMRQLQLKNPQVSVPMLAGEQTIRSDAPLFEIVSSLELAGINPRINWWVRAGQWSQWGLTSFDRLLLCRFAATVMSEKDPKYHRLLGLMTLCVASRVDEAARSSKSVRETDGPAIEISVNAIRDDLIGLENMLNFLPGKADPGKQASVAINIFVNSKLLHYTDASRKKVRILRPDYAVE